MITITAPIALTEANQAGFSSILSTRILQTRTLVPLAREPSIRFGGSDSDSAFPSTASVLLQSSRGPCHLLPASRHCQIAILTLRGGALIPVSEWPL